MRRNLLATTALTTSTTLVTGVAMAANLNLPVKAPPAPPPAPFSWTGCYIGGNAGAAWTSIDQSLTTAPPFRIITSDSGGHDTSFTGGGQLGCNLQVAPNWVFGLEGDINYLRGSHSQSFRILSEDAVLQTRVRWLATIRPRFGYAWERSFLYATGGLALGGINSSVTASPLPSPAHTTFSGSTSTTRAGWTIGAGYEYAFSDRVSLKLEYLHFDFGDTRYNVPRVDGVIGETPWTSSAKVSGDIVRAGINYKFVPW
jgi:outer membrane immunogenic protein